MVDVDDAVYPIQLVINDGMAHALGGGDDGAGAMHRIFRNVERGDGCVVFGAQFWPQARGRPRDVKVPVGTSPLTDVPKADAIGISADEAVPVHLAPPVVKVLDFRKRERCRFLPNRIELNVAFVSFHNKIA